MSLQYPNRDLAAGAVTGATGAEIWSAGATPARTGAGVFTLTLDQPADASECAILITCRGAKVTSMDAPTVIHTSDSVKQVEFYVDGVATDPTGFDYHVLRAPF